MTARADAAATAVNALVMHGISKGFDGKAALEDASFELAWGEVHALVGENGAGKSTLMNIAAGIYASDSGTQSVGGMPLSPRSPVEATAAGIGMVHQHFRLVERFTVAENVLLTLGARGAARTPRAAAGLIRAKATEVGLVIDPTKIVSDMSVAERQRAEILKVLLLGARIIILDEPTAVLTEDEAQALLGFTRQLAAQGNAIVLITHKLREVAGWSDRITVMRHGKTVLAGASARNISEAAVAKLIVGEAIVPTKASDTHPGAVCLAVSDLTLASDRARAALDGLGIELRAGEVLGIAGVGGNGQDSLVSCLTGLVRPTAGRIVLRSEDVTAASPRLRRSLGLRVIPADRFSTGLVRDMTIAENMALPQVAQGAFGRVRLDRKSMRRNADDQVARFDIRGASAQRRTSLLSGGNAQKVLLAREFDSGLRVLIAQSPSRGLDMKATEFVRSAIREAVEKGAGCLLISEDLQEVLALSHRVAVMNRGRIVGCRPIADVTPEWIGALLTGHA